MIRIDEQNIEFLDQIQKILISRGVDSCKFSTDKPISNGSENIFVACVESDFDFRQDKNLVLFLKSNNFQKAVLFSWDSSDFKTELHLNAAIIIVKLPISFYDN